MRIVESGWRDLALESQRDREWMRPSRDEQGCGIWKSKLVVPHTREPIRPRMNWAFLEEIPGLIGSLVWGTTRFDFQIPHPCLSLEEDENRAKPLQLSFTHRLNPWIDPLRSFRRIACM